MILQFDDHDALRLALTAGAVPPEIHAAPAVVGRDDEDRVLVETAETVPNETRRALRELGVKGRRSWPKEVERLSIVAWPQAFPVERSAAKPVVDDRTPVLFEITGGELLPEIVGEMLRLGNDRQSFRYLVDEDDESIDRVLLRVVGPPYYSLLRALDRDADGTRPTAYVERAPRVWVEIGCEHPFAHRLEPPPRTEWLLSPPHDWRALDEAPFTDVDQLLDFQLPRPATSLEDRELDRRLDVPLRLARGESGESGELWVLTGEAVGQLDEFVRTSRDHLLDRLAFAVARSGDEEIVVVRTRPGRGTPPVVVLDGLACRPYLKLPNLFLPVGRRLHPPLRRDTVKSLLCEDDKLLTWLHPDDGEAGAFTPFRLPDHAFRPLSDWVDYVLDRESEPLEEWMRSTRFEFDRFVCPEEQKERQKRDRDAERSKEKSEKRKPPRQKLPRSKEVVAKPARGPRDESRFVPAEQPAERRALEDRLRTLEQEFLASETEADGPDRMAAWTEMAELNARLGHFVDAAICWSQRIWEEETPAPDDAWSWYACEFASGQRTDSRRAEDVVPFDDEQLDELLTNPNPSPTRVQALAAFLVWLVVTGEPVEAVVERLALLQRFLERHETMLSIRARWLAARALFELSDRDVLALARTRDRTLELLFAHGTRPDRDLPSFLRGAGLRGGERFRIVRDRVVDLHAEARKWMKRHLNPNREHKKPDEPPVEIPRTDQYVDLVFAFGLGKLGETEAARRLLDSARAELHDTDTIHRSLLDMYAVRVQQAIDGRPTSAPLPEEVLARLDQTFSPSEEELEVFDRDERVKLEKDLRDDRYKVDRLRQHSRVLEPHERIDAYRNYRRGFTSDLARELSELSDVTDRGELTGRVTNLLDRDHSPEERGLVLTGHADGDPQNREVGLLDVGPRVGQVLSERILDAAKKHYEVEPDVVGRAVLLERSLYLAGHFDLRDDVTECVSTLHGLLAGQTDADIDTLKSLQQLFAESFRGLRRLGMREDIARLLERLENLVAAVDPSRSKLKSQNLVAWRKVVLESAQMQLQVASGWFYFGEFNRAWPIVDHVRKLLFDGKDLLVVHCRDLACAYVTALGQSPVEEAVPRMVEVFAKLGSIHDSATTNSHYSVSQLKLVEAVVLAMVGEDMVLDRGARRWLEEDEYLVRRRIHRDVREAMASAE